MLKDQIVYPKYIQAAQIATSCEIHIYR